MHRIFRLALCLCCAACGGQLARAPRASFGSNVEVARCVLPSGADPAAARALYARWKTDLVTAEGADGFLRVRRPNSGTQLNSTNSEGIAYGMLLAVYFDDRATFDALWRYEQRHLGKHGLMEWEIAPDGTVIGSGAATDGDEDMAFALLMAAARWSEAAYAHLAAAQIALIWQYEVDHARADTLMPGDDFDGAKIVNISYFAPAYYRAFGEATGNVAGWQRVVDASYAALERTLSAANGNVETGLVPAWSSFEGVPTVPPGTSHPIHHQLDSCRTPFRIAQDACWNGEPRAHRYLEKITAFHARVGVGQLLDGYELDGRPRPEAKLHLAAFVAGAGAAAMAVPRAAAVRDGAYAEILRWDTLLGGSRYYNESWSVLGALMLTGGFENFMLSPR